VGTGLTIGDLNGDGRPDLAVAAAGGQRESVGNARISVVALP
jgi:hypothetical protein